ncbi:hypothetical protein A8B98_23730 [Hymenobacter sp. UV11]|nr:hypothetical protein A8B98_23730 [Hymenobacter sp. UV11]
MGGSVAACAQAPTPPYDPNVAHRSIQALQLWPELQGELVLPNGDYLLLALRGERAASGAGSVDRSLGVDTRRARVAYEHFGSATWSYGATVQLVGNGSGTSVIPEILLRHRSPIFGAVTFGQRLSLERNFAASGIAPPLGSGPDGQTWTRLRVDLEKLLPLGSDVTGLALRPRLSYEASTHLRLQKATNDPDERTIQYTSLRGEVGVRLSPSLDFTPWFAYQTAYQQNLVFTDATGTIPVSGGKVNAIYPTVGLDVRFTLLPSGNKADRKQLPTQH